MSLGACSEDKVERFEDLKWTAWLGLDSEVSSWKHYIEQIDAAVNFTISIEIDVSIMK